MITKLSPFLATCLLLSCSITPLKQPTPPSTIDQRLRQHIAQRPQFIEAQITNVVAQPPALMLQFRYPTNFPTTTPWWYLLYSTNVTVWDFYPQDKYITTNNTVWVTNEMPWCFFRIVAVR